MSLFDGQLFRGAIIIMLARCRTIAKHQTHKSTPPPATTPTPHPSCSNGRHRFGDIGPLPRLMSHALKMNYRSPLTIGATRGLRAPRDKAAISDQMLIRDGLPPPCGRLASHQPSSPTKGGSVVRTFAADGWGEAASVLASLRPSRTTNYNMSERNPWPQPSLAMMSNDGSYPVPIVVLVVDDEAVLRLIASDVLEENGFQVLEAENAKAALKMLAEHPGVRVLFTDINMPGALDGLDLAREVHVRWPAIKLVVTSGRAKPLGREMPDSVRFVAKPYSPDRLVEEIRQALVL